MKPIRFLLVVAAVSVPALCQSRYLPLFVIERSTNANVVRYDAQVTSEGKLDAKEPVIAYWILAAKDGRREGLNAVEKKTAYGFSVSPGGPDGVFRMFLVSQPKREIRVSLVNGTARAEMVIAGRQALLQKVFVSTGKLNILRVNYVELHGTDLVSGEPRYEKIAD